MMLCMMMTAMVTDMTAVATVAAVVTVAAAVTTVVAATVVQLNGCDEGPQLWAAA